MAYDAARGVTVLFGGDPEEADGRLLGDTWEWDGSRWTRRDAARRIPVTEGRSASWTPIRLRL